MASINTQKQAAKAFVQEWSGKGYEKGETQRFWIDLLHSVFGIDNPTKIMEFEMPVKTFAKDKGSDFIDAYIATTKVLIEQKGSHIDLSAKARQSDGMELTPFQQGLRYASGLGTGKYPRWIVACNFTTFEVHDMERPNDAPEVIQLSDLEKEYHRLTFLIDETNVHLKKELEVSIQAGEIVGVLYDKILAQYRNPEDPETQKSLNKLCVRLVFCLYAEDAGIFGSKNMFHDYMEQFPASMLREQLIKLFRILNLKPEDRDPYEDEKLLAFPYVNGGMFAGDIEIPRINEEIRTLILQRASDDFDWSLISPTIFGAVFESTLNPETRRAGGMHYTSIENIHKVIDPLFLNDLKAELTDIKTTSVAKTKKERAYAFQNKISKLKFFDPACGSGNFLTESYTSLRRLENEALKIIYGSDRVIGEFADPIKVSINQFYGIEINDFACSVAQTALWIAESQMMAATDEIVGFNLDPLPLKTYTNIHEGNALRMDWNDVVPASELDFIMGNPPFIGASMMTAEQKNEAVAIFGKGKRVNSIDYVGAWYHKAAEMIQGTNIKVAFVSTNSITQGEQVGPLWEKLLTSYKVKINFAYRTFKWNSEAKDKAAVHCVIIGFSQANTDKKTIYYSDGLSVVAANINPYLVDGPDVLVTSQGSPLCNVPRMTAGNKPADGGNLILSQEERDAIVKDDPKANSYIKRYIGSRDFINNDEIRYCLWLRDIDPAVYRSNKEVMRRLQAVKDMRLASTAAPTRAYAAVPYLFFSAPQTDSNYLAIPEVSSGARKYIPIGFLDSSIIASNKLLIVPDASLYHFGILTSIVHMAWVSVVGGRMKSDYSYSGSNSYNNFPWPTPNEEQRARIEQTAQCILDARAQHPDSSYADMYDELTMPTDIRRAHHANDAAVLEAYGFPKDATESDIATRLFKMYRELTNK